MTTYCTRQAYVDSVVRHYIRLPGTPLRASRRDRWLAAALYDRGIPLRVVWTAFVIAAVRWGIRGPQQRKLEKIRTLYYFLPTIDEVLSTSIEPSYIQYLAARLKPLVREKEALLTSPAASDLVPAATSRRSENRDS